MDFYILNLKVVKVCGWSVADLHDKKLVLR